MEYKHVSVLLNECLNALCLKDSGIYVDGTLGGAGHASQVLEKIKNGTLIGIDRDREAIENAADRWQLSDPSELGFKSGLGKDGSNRVVLVHDNFNNITEIMPRAAALLGEDAGTFRADGILLDLGVSSHQLDDAERGFSYMQDAPLDMRMNRDDSFSAYDVVNGYTEGELKKVIEAYGEEKWAARIAEFIVRERSKQAFQTTFELVECIKRAIPASARRDGPHPAKRTFQAIRIEVNGELRILQKAIEDMVAILKPGGRLCIISFHSLEDRIVKQTFKTLQDPCTCPKTFPVCICGKKPQIRIVDPKGETPSEEELNENPRSRSARLRIAEKI